MTLLVKGGVLRYLQLSTSLLTVVVTQGVRDYCVPTTMAKEETVGNFSAVFVTCPNMEVAKKISRNLVQNKLAACVNILPQVTSVYEWEGTVEEDTECLMVIKTQTARIPDLSTFVEANHPYDVPEVISMNIEHGSEKYLAWVKQCTEKTIK